ncbi:MAG: homocysteine S-methyltransferase family protein [Lachnospiraceae bacterium]|jgi:5-methyltetrahydrofolate--homocysteine methyltransferase|nr:homocysteine S-methyltransferase family protein [Lachnospiraceae bacterium]
MNLIDKVGKEIIVLDGGMGSILQDLGLASGEIPETWNILKPEKLINIHKSYIEAGSRIILSNTFGANSLKFANTDFELEDIVKSAIENAKEAIMQAKAEQNIEEDVYVALDLGPTGKLLKPMGDLDFEDCVDLYKEVIRYGIEEGIDLIYIETMSDTYELKACVVAAKEMREEFALDGKLPIFATVTFDEKGKLLTGGDVASVVALLEGLRVDAIGMNCGLGPVQMMPIIKEFLSLSSTPVIVKPNAGLPKQQGEKVYYDITSDEFAKEVALMIEMGVSVVGGCCGTTPEYIEKLVTIIGDEKSIFCSHKNEYLQIDKYAFIEEKRSEDYGNNAIDVNDIDNNKLYKKIDEDKIILGSDKNITLVSSYGKAVKIGDHPIFVGERINPTGKKKFKEALLNKNMEYILQEALRQEEAGADVLDVNVGMPGIDEGQTMKEVVTEIQSVTNLPLQIDTMDEKALSLGLRYYNGKPMVNSVNGKKEEMDKVFPLVKKYGGVLVVLPIDEDGIPETAEGRVEVARNIIKEASKYGIKKKDIIVDALVMTISTDPQNAKTTLDTVSLLKSELGVHVILGVSNVSFGLPNRGLINSKFLEMAMARGLDAGIINPMSKEMKEAILSHQIMMGYGGDLVEDILALGDLQGDTKENEQLLQQLASLNSQYISNMNTLLSGHNIANVDSVSLANKGDIQKSTSSDRGASTEDVSDIKASDTKKRTPLEDKIIKGLKDGAVADAKEALKNIEPMDIIEEQIMPALDYVGENYEAGKIYLPGLLMSAEAAKGAFAIISDEMEKNSVVSEKKDKVVIATVEGDIHDIGKNIVKVLLANYGFEVIDLGKDVKPELIIETVAKTGAKLVGLSALMTTTLPAMKKTVELVKENFTDVKTMIGGAVVTDDYRKEIGADFYGKDAMESVRIAQGVMKGKK